MAKGTQIKIKSEELEIPFSHVLAGYVMELVVAMVSPADYGKDLWLCNYEDFGIEVYKKKIHRELFFQYVGKEDLHNISQTIQKDLTEYLHTQGLGISEIREMESDIKTEIYVDASIEEMYIPFSITIEKMEQSHGFPKLEHLRLFMENNKTVDIMCFPLEQNVAYHLAEILQKLELINEMNHYILLYDILKKYPLEGRKVKDELEKQCEKMHIAKTDKPFSIWSTYGNYGYMKKKWKVLLRQEKRSEPTWQEAFDVIHHFLEPMWDCICQETIFFGDWMPELGRFLD